MVESRQQTGRGDHYTVKELADLAGLSDGRIRQLLNDGTIQGRKQSYPRGDVWLIPVGAAEAWLESRKGRS